jgi:hypothetical protein
MIQLKKIDGYMNVFSVDVYSQSYSNTINGEVTGKGNQLTPNFLNQIAGFQYAIELTNKLTGKVIVSDLNQIGFVGDNFPRSVKFGLFVDDLIAFAHVNLVNSGLYKYKIFRVTNTGAKSIESHLNVGVVSTGLVMVHNEKTFTESHFTSESIIIPEAISYNG